MCCDTVVFLHSGTCSTASLAPSRGLSGSTFTSAVRVNTSRSDTLEQALRAPCVKGKEERAVHSFQSLPYTYFQSGKASLLLRPVGVDFDCLAGPELLELCELVASLTCTLAGKYTADEAQRLSRKGSKDKSCSANQDLLSSL